MARIETTIDVPAEITVHKVHGKVTFEEVRAKLHEYYKGPVTRLILWDCLEGDMSAITAADIRGMASLASEYSHMRPNGKTALVLMNIGDFGDGRMLEAYASSNGNTIKIMPFRDMISAYAWLGICRK